MPSSAHMKSTSSPVSARSRAAAAIAHGACTREPNGDSTTVRQSPSSSRNDSTTMHWSLGSSPVASAWSAT